MDRPDLIRDFEPGRDKFDFQKMDADIHAEGNQSFVFIGAAEFGGHAGELRFAGGRLSADVDGDAQADLQVRVADISSLRAADFIL
jgi:serralysin